MEYGGGQSQPTPAHKKHARASRIAVATRSPHTRYYPTTPASRSIFGLLGGLLCILAFDDGCRDYWSRLRRDY